MHPVATTLPGGAAISLDWSHADTVRLVVSGEIDAADVRALDELAAAVRPLTSIGVEVDASALRFLDVAGARGLRRLTRALSDGGSVVATGMSAAALLAWNAVAVSDPRPVVGMNGRAA